MDCVWTQKINSPLHFSVPYYRVVVREIVKFEPLVFQVTPLLKIWVAYIANQKVYQGLNIIARRRGLCEHLFRGCVGCRFCGRYKFDFF